MLKIVGFRFLFPNNSMFNYQFQSHLSDYRKTMLLNFGPQHPAAHGVLRLILELEGEYIVKADPHIGLLHRGTEKLMETKNILQGLPYLDRLDYVSIMVQEHCYCLTVESLYNMSISSSILYVRILFDEITRILNHLLSITTHALDIGALTPFLWGFEEREKLMNFYEMVSGARLHAAFYWPGGLAYTIPANLLEQIHIFSNAFLSRIDELEDLLTENRIWKQRLIGIGYISKTEAITNGFSGIMLRGSGIPWDLRKLIPYSQYAKLHFYVPISTNGDCYDRYCLRLFEMRQSIALIQQCLNFLTTNGNSITELREHQKRNMEVTIGQFVHYNLKQDISISARTSYSAVEAPKGEFGVWLSTQFSYEPYRCKFKAPGFLHLQGLNMMSTNYMLADLVANIGTLDIVFGEVDR